MVYCRWDKRSGVTARTAGRKLDFVATTATQLRLFISRSSSRTPVRIPPQSQQQANLSAVTAAVLYARHFRDVAVGWLYMGLRWKSTVYASVFLWFAKAYSRRIARGLNAHRFSPSPRLTQSKLIKSHAQPRGRLHVSPSSVVRRVPAGYSVGGPRRGRKCFFSRLPATISAMSPWAEVVWRFDDVMQVTWFCWDLYLLAYSMKAEHMNSDMCCTTTNAYHAHYSGCFISL